MSKSKEELIEQKIKNEKEIEILEHKIQRLTNRRQNRLPQLFRMFEIFFIRKRNLFTALHPLRHTLSVYSFENTVLDKACRNSRGSIAEKAG